MRKIKSPYVSIFGWGIFLAGALSFASCSTEELIDNGQTDIPIKFGGVKTRVTHASEIKEFEAFAEMTYLVETGNGYKESEDFIPLLANERVYRTGEDQDGDFTYVNTRYWVEERAFRFFGVHPYMGKNDQNESIVTPTVFNDMYDGYTIPFTTPADASTDLMIAYTQNMTYNGITPEEVEMDFEHLLSKVSVKVAKNSQNENNKVVVKSITLSGATKSGVFNTAYSDAYTDNWSFPSTETISFSPQPTDGGWILDVTSTEIINGLMLIPQPITDGKIKIEILYDYYNKSSDTTPQEEDLLAEAYIPVPANRKWEAATQYSYNIVLAAEDNNIRFTTPTVKPWGTPQSAGTIIIN